MSTPTTQTTPRAPARTGKRAAPAKPRARLANTPAAQEESATRVLRGFFRIVFNAVKTHFRDVEKKAGLAGVLPAVVASLDSRTLARLEKDLATLIAVLPPDERSGQIPMGQS